MGKQRQRKNKKKFASSSDDNNCTFEENELGEGWAFVDPDRIRFQHSKIRPKFSGCGRSVVQTLDEIRQGLITPYDLPPIQVIVGGESDRREKSTKKQKNNRDVERNNDIGSECEQQQPWYFSLNNRRLWVLKRCKEENLLAKTNGLIKVRVREPKSQNERQRYTIQNCSLDATFIREATNTDEKRKNCMEYTKEKITPISQGEISNEVAELNLEEGNDSESTVSSDDEDGSYTNPFSLLS